LTAESPPAPKKFHWVEGRYRRDDASVFTKRSYLKLEERCPPTAQDDSGRTGKLIEGSCIEVNKECFIATAAFGSGLDGRVRLLRKFRDDVLLQTDLREPFSRVLASYYRFGPPVAVAMKRRRAVKLLLKWVLAYPAVLFARSFVALLRTTHREWAERSYGEGREP
jgi:hypothetical protein